MQIVSQLENQHKKEEARLKAMTEYLQVAGSKSEEDRSNEGGSDCEDTKSCNDTNGHASPPAYAHNNGHGFRADIIGGAGRNGSDGLNGGGGAAGMNIFNTAAAFAALNNHQPQHSAAAGNPFLGR